MRQKRIRYELKSGERLTVAVQTPPLEPDDRRAEKMFWWGDIRDRVVNGELAAKGLNATFFSAELAGEPVGSIVLLTSQCDHEIGLVEFVGTAPEHRGKGVAEAVLRTVIAWFEAEGGRALYLCTTNPIARRLYTRNGFKPCVGDGLRRVAGGRDDPFDRDDLSHQGAARVRTAQWGDMPRFAPLYNDPRSDVFLKDSILPVFQDGRYESHFKQMMIPHEQDEGIFLVLETPRGRIAGSCFLKEQGSFYEQHIGRVDCMVAPAYRNQAPELLAAMCDRAQERGLELLIHRGAGCDTWKLSAFAEAGFQQEASIEHYYRTETGRHAMVMNVRRLEQRGNGAPRKTRDRYYGYRDRAGGGTGCETL